MASAREIATAIVNTRATLKDMRNARMAGGVFTSPLELTYHIHSMIDEALLILQKELERLQ